MNLKERLEEVMLDVEDVAAERIAVAFPELFDEEFQPGDDPVHPVIYIDNNNILFRDRYNRFFFWDHLFTEVHGPYDSILQACEEMNLYAKEEGI